MLFQSNVCQDSDSEGGEIMRLAKTVARRCNGLPLALEIIGNSMIDATILMWRETEKNLLRSPQLQKGMKEVLYLLKFNFDESEDDNTRNFLLYCCTFEEEIVLKDSLINLWFVEGFLDQKGEITKSQCSYHRACYKKRLVMIMRGCMMLFEKCFYN